MPTFRRAGSVINPASSIVPRPKRAAPEKQLSIQEYIEQNKISLETTLELTSRDGTFPVLPEGLFELSHIVRLELYGLNIKSGLEQLSKLPNLQELHIGKCLTSTSLLELSYVPQLTTLYYSSEALTDLPEDLNNWSSLIYLNLAGCTFISLVNGLPPNLNYLFLPGNLLEEIPAIVFSLRELTKLVLSDFDFIEIPAAITKLELLESLFINECVSPELPEELDQLKHLEYLWLYETNLAVLPPVITRIKTLTHLILSRNFLSLLPDSLSELSNLQELDLSANYFQEIPHVIFQLKNLEILNLAQPEYLERLERNNITHIPNEFLKLEKLRTITLGGNSISNVPIEIIAQGVDAIRSYLLQLETTDKDFLFEAKLLVLGEPNAGKTSLTRKIEDPTAPLPAPNETTLGIDVRKYLFPITATDFPDAIQPGQNKKFRLNIWDFGGQEIYKATHRFFLSDRAVYLLVADSRSEDTDFPYWLHIVEIFGGKSPLVIIVNARGVRERAIDESGFRGHFTNIKDILVVDLGEKSKKRLNNIRALVRSLAVSLPHVGSAVPATWTTIRKALETDKRNQIDVQEYLDLCAANGIPDSKDALILSQYFHDIGVFLHFQEDELLSKKIFLKPTWATNAVYKVLDDELLKEQYGRFNRKQAATIWHEAQFAPVRDELLKLMQNFFLTYRISDSQDYIVPDKLPAQRPDYEWDATSNLVLLYKYEFFMPKGLLTQFIIKKHQYITNQDLVWRRGVLLERFDTTAEVTETYGARTLQVRIAGKYKRDFMTLLTEELDFINAQYSNLKVEKLIPCNCSECLGSDEPNYYELSDLQTRVERNKETIECKKSKDYAQVNVRGLIDEVFNPMLAETQHQSELTAMLQAKRSENASAVSSGKIFISYAHKNENRLNELLEHFKTLEHAGIKVDPWSDKRIEGGMNWKEEINQAMQECKVAILLVSTPFLASNFIMTKELPTILAAAKDRGVTLLSVVVGECRFTETPFLQDYQAMNQPSKPLSSLRPGERDKVYMKVIDRAKALLTNSTTHS
jgi:internalin A